jgi:DNA polymerase-3 subunit chi
VPRTAAERTLAGQLFAVRPGLLTAYEAALPGARAAVLTRLWRGLVHEPLPWVVRRETVCDGVALHLADGRRLHGPPSDPWGTAASVSVLELEGTKYGHASELMAALLLPGPAGPDGGVFTAELDNSTASLALSRTAVAPQEALQGTPRGSPARLWEWEQQVVDGHPYHPGCRSRPGITAAEQLAYAPEHRPLVELGLAAVDDCLTVGNWPARLRDRGAVLIPVHPWQADHVLPGPLRPVRGSGSGIPAHPLMSLRTLAPAWNGMEGMHVKVALSTRLTSSVREISRYSIENADTVSTLLESLAHRLDGRLHITRTLAASTHSPRLAAVLRESPHLYADPDAGEQVVPVAALAGHIPGPDRTAWLADFARLALNVCLRLLDLGVALEAHGQNLLVVLDAEDRPLRLVYRDLADIRISPARLARHGTAAPPLTGRLLTDDPTALRRKLFGSLITGALGPLAGGAQALRTVLAAALQDVPPCPDLEALRTEPLPAKALTMMRLNPAAGGDAWSRLPNPLTEE